MLAGYITTRIFRGREGLKPRCVAFLYVGGRLSSASRAPGRPSNRQSSESLHRSRYRVYAPYAAHKPCYMLVLTNVFSMLGHRSPEGASHGLPLREEVLKLFPSIHHCAHINITPLSSKSNSHIGSRGPNLPELRYAISYPPSSPQTHHISSMLLILAP